ncbi:MAG: hypothetical protein AAF741_04925 [Bacteroidota bacterium]
MFLRFIALIFCAFPILLTAQNFSGIFQPSEADLKYTNTRGWDAFESSQASYASQGYRLIDLESVRSQDGGDRTFYGIFSQSSLQDSIGRYLGWADFVRAKRQMASNGWMIVDVHGYALNERDYQYIGVWVKDETPHKIAKLTTREGLDKRIDAMGKRRYKLKRVSVIESPSGEPTFVALFHFSPVYEYNFVYYSDDSDDFKREYSERYQSNTRLIDFASFFDESKTWYLGVFQAADYEGDFRRSETKPELDATREDLKNERGLAMLNLNVW